MATKPLYLTKRFKSESSIVVFKSKLTKSEIAEMIDLTGNVYLIPNNDKMHQVIISQSDCFIEL